MLHCIVRLTAFCLLIGGSGKQKNSNPAMSAGAGFILIGALISHHQNIVHQTMYM